MCADMKNTTESNETCSKLLGYKIPAELSAVLESCPGFVQANSEEDLIELALRDVNEFGYHDVAYEVPGKGRILEAKVCKVNNGIAANYIEPYMRRRDPDCMYIGDERPTNKPKYSDTFGHEFEDVRQKTFEWLKTQELAVFPFIAGMPGKGTDAIVVAPANAGFFALGLAMLQGIVASKDIPEGFSPKAIIYVAPPFRHTHFSGKQVVVHNRRQGLHELFSYNLYPGPSAKKGIYGVLLNLGEGENWLTMHCSTVQVVTPYENKMVISHEGASGGGKSEMLEQAHRERDASLLLGKNLETGEKRHITLPRSCDLRPVTDDMALCHPSLNLGKGKLSLMDAESAWFVRVNHIHHYGIDPYLEEMTIHAKKPLLFLSIDAKPGSTALIWDHIEDSPGKPCPNPRVIVPRSIVPGIIDGPVAVDVRSFGVRTPPCTRENPSYGIIGLMHVLPPALAWLWRLVAPRGHANPSIVQTEGMSSEGVGSYWPFATGRRVDQANLLLEQILETPEVRYILTPNQHIGVWEVGFMGQWIAREFIAHRGGAKFNKEQTGPARCPLLGYSLKPIMVEGRMIGPWFLEVDKQPEVGETAYDAGAEILEEFFHRELRSFLDDDLHPLGRKIIKCCLNGGTLADYEAFIDIETISEE
jgi:hypothetical protein